MDKFFEKYGYVIFVTWLMIVTTALVAAIIFVIITKGSC